jgi:uncharacterized RDD family membrane protein YckC
MKIKRIIAYIIDISIVYLISSVILSLPIVNYDTKQYLEYYEEYTEVLMSSEEPTEEVVDKQYNLMYKMSYIAKSSLVVQAIVTFGYFGIAAYLMKGQTLGKKIQHIKVTSINNKEMNPHLFILRSVILTNLIPQIASILAIYLLKESLWITAESIIGNVSMMITSALVIVLIFRNDERSLHDLICKTKVIEVPKTEKKKEA